jgi:hypothetical protein
MNERNLPEDPARWPTDPFVLLGVARDVLPRDLRRAYTALIRVYKPEQYPEQFRRIREAYEILSRYAEFNFPRSDEPPAETPVAEGSYPTHAPIFEEELAAAWEEACNGATASAYAHLRQLHERFPGRDDACVRLYWLLALEPELDNVRDACGWLTEALTGSGLSGPARELYRRELAANPAEAASERCTRLLSCPAPPFLLLDLLEWRWHAAASGPLVALVQHDTEALRARLIAQDEHAWARVLLVAIHHLAWSEDAAAEDLLGDCYRELESLTHVHQFIHEELAQLDYLLELAAAWEDAKKQGGVPVEFLSLIPRSWSRPLAEYRTDLMRFLAQVSAALEDHLTLFDRIRARFPALLLQMGNMLTSLQYTAEPPPDPRSGATMAERLFELVSASPWQNYPRFREVLLSYCVSECVAPESVATALAELPNHWLKDRHLSQAVFDDWPLRYVCLAHRLLWT